MANPFSWFRRPKAPEMQGKDTKYQAITKHYVFNETGNIMLCATPDSLQQLDGELKTAFVDISVFFAAMTKALASTENPITKRPYSLFNYQAVKNILADSGLFVETNVEQGTFSHEGVGRSLTKAWLQHVLNRDFGDQPLPFSGAMFNGMGYQQAQPSQQQALDEQQKKLCRGGSIFFIGELLLGVPQTSAVLLKVEPLSVNSDAEMTEPDPRDIFSLAALDESKHQAKHKVRHWRFKRRTYLFVPPKYIAHAAHGLELPEDKEFANMVALLSDSLAKLQAPLA